MNANKTPLCLKCNDYTFGLEDSYCKVNGKLRQFSFKELADFDNGLTPIWCNLKDK